VNKFDIEDKISQGELLRYYIGNIKKPIRSPFRKDNFPTITFKDYGGKVLWRDWATGEHGDALDFLYRLFGSQSYSDLFKKINSDLNLQQSQLLKLPTHQKVSTVQKKDIQVTYRFFNDRDLSYWNSNGISLNTLGKYGVYALSEVWLNGRSMLESYVKNPLYGYKYSLYKDDTRWKIYRPFAKAKDIKFLYNGTVDIIEGYDQLPWYGKTLLITKSLKDVMLLHDLGWSAISLQGEANSLGENIFSVLSSRFEIIILFYDNDKAGYEGANKLSQKYGLPKIFIPENDEGIKDITDYCKIAGKENASILMNNLISEGND